MCGTVCLILTLMAGGRSLSLVSTFLRDVTLSREQSADFQLSTPQKVVTSWAVWWLLGRCRWFQLSSGMSHYHENNQLISSCPHRRNLELVEAGSGPGLTGSWGGRGGEDCSQGWNRQEQHVAYVPRLRAWLKSPSQDSDLNWILKKWQGTRIVPVSVLVHTL